MNTGFQYNEESIIRKLFPNMVMDLEYSTFPETGTIVEIGAADGIDNSNSHWLINECCWDALLVEPHPGYFMDLIKLYANDKRIKLSNYAIASTTSRRRLNLDNQCSSLVYPKSISIEVQCVTLTELLDLYCIPNDFELLSIDCEGADMEVLSSLDWKKYKPHAVCVEHSMPLTDLYKLMDLVGYKDFDRNMGNTFFVRK